MEQLINYHDIAMEELFEQYEICRNDKKQIVENFLASFSSGNKKLRATLPVFAIMQTFPKHEFYNEYETLPNKILPCTICSDPYGYGASNSDDEELIESCMVDTGGLIGSDMDTLAYYLKEYNKSRNSSHPVIKEDLNVFSEIINVILNADEPDTIRTIAKKMKKLNQYKAKTEEIQMLLETLGYYGILETDKHRGAFHKYTNLGVAPRKSHNSDWHYPVDFWVGSDGIDKEAFKYWFGDYKELVKLIK